VTTSAWWPSSPPRTTPETPNAPGPAACSGGAEAEGKRTSDCGFFAGILLASVFRAGVFHARVVRIAVSVGDALRAAVVADAKKNPQRGRAFSEHDPALGLEALEGRVLRLRRAGVIAHLLLGAVDLVLATRLIVTRLELRLAIVTETFLALRRRVRRCGLETLQALRTVSVASVDRIDRPVVVVIATPEGEPHKCNREKRRERAQRNSTHLKTSITSTDYRRIRHPEGR
jgi:hypothetical protein